MSLKGDRVQKSQTGRMSVWRDLVYSCEYTVSNRVLDISKLLRR